MNPSPPDPLPIHLRNEAEAASLYPSHVYPHGAGLVRTVDVGKWFLENLSPVQRIIMRIDVEGAEYRVLRRLLTLGFLCWPSVIEIEFHGLYSKANAAKRPLDVALPWLLRGCPDPPRVEI